MTRTEQTKINYTGTVKFTNATLIILDYNMCSKTMCYYLK